MPGCGRAFPHEWFMPARFDMQTKVPHFSFEFFPPRNAEQKLILESTWQKLAGLRPDYLSVTFGAGGSTLNATRETVNELVRASGVQVAPHISCMAKSREMIHELLQHYQNDGVKRLVVLRGDRPEGMTGPGPFQFANELVAYIREQFGDAFRIEVACYPEFHRSRNCNISVAKCRLALMEQSRNISTMLTAIFVSLMNVRAWV